MQSKRKWLLVLALMAVGAGVLWWRSKSTPRPWANITPQQLEAVIEHRHRGLAYLEGFSPQPKAGNPSGLAVQEFQAIERLQPALAFGFANEAVARLNGLSGSPLSGKALADAIAQAETAARKAVELQPAKSHPRIILARILASSERHDEAVEQLQDAVRVEPNHLRGWGELIAQMRQQGSAEAVRSALRPILEKAAAAGPDNAVAQAELLEAAAQENDTRLTAQLLDRFVSLLSDLPTGTSERIAQAKALLAKGDATAARPLLFQARNLSTQTPAWSTAYTALYGNAQDPADLAVRAFDPPPPDLPLPAPPQVEVRFEDNTGSLAALRVQTAPHQPVLHPIASGDLNGDGLPDLAIATGGGPAAVYLNGNNDNRFKQKSALASRPTGIKPDPARGIYLLDLDIDLPEGRAQSRHNPGLYTVDADAIYLSASQAKPEQYTFLGAPAAGLSGTGSVCAADFDQDGDLDLIRTRYATTGHALQYLRNDAAGHFTDITRSTGLAAPAHSTRQAIALEYDEDGDADLFVCHESGASKLYENLRQDRFREVGQKVGLKSTAGSLAAAIADPDHDGWMDLLIVGKTPQSTIFYHNEKGRFRADETFTKLLSGFQPAHAAFVDYNNDGWIDLAFAGSSATGGLRLLRNDRGKWSDDSKRVADVPAARYIHVFDFNNDGAQDFLLVLRDGALRLLRNRGAEKNNWLKISLSGVQTGSGDGGNAGGEGNNSYAVGAKVEVMAGRDYQKFVVEGPVTHVGLGAHKKPDVVRVTWTHGVPYNFLDVGPNQARELAQVPQSSCPFLYAWNGERFAIVTDCNWRSPLGMLFARGAPIPHHLTRDFVRVPGEALKENEGILSLAVVEELREINYLDQAALMVVDHPPGTEVYVDERMVLGTPTPLTVYPVRRKRLPVAARDGQGND
ncbi:MAG TPA: FG-GAP-like repeat-containing protein, partial [Abditibacteriaceae bacterium]|nr:FG-GAP-like repeat-containing protein [Abditibacteriaceae bacterium]